jgi:hypothetical protein
VNSGREEQNTKSKIMKIIQAARDVKHQARDALGLRKRKHAPKKPIHQTIQAVKSTKSTLKNRLLGRTSELELSF